MLVLKILADDLTTFSYESFWTAKSNVNFIDYENPLACKSFLLFAILFVWLVESNNDRYSAGIFDDYVESEICISVRWE